MATKELLELYQITKEILPNCTVTLNEIQRRVEVKGSEALLKDRGVFINESLYVDNTEACTSLIKCLAHTHQKTMIEKEEE